MKHDINNIKEWIRDKKRSYEILFYKGIFRDILGILLTLAWLVGLFILFTLNNK